MARLAFKDKRELREMTWVDLRKFTVWKQGESDGRKRLHPEKRMGFRNTVESLSLNLNCGTDTSPTRPGGNQCDVEIGSLINTSCFFTGRTATVIRPDNLTSCESYLLVKKQI